MTWPGSGRSGRATWSRDGSPGKADSEVGQRWLEDRWAEHELELTWPEADDRRGAPDPCRALAALHGELGGQANLMALTPAA